MKQFRWLTALVVGAFLSLGAVAFALASGPQLVPGNPSCQDLGFDHELKSDTGDSNTVSMLIDGFLVEAEVVSDGIYFDFYTNVPVKGVIAKGGDDANFYDYRPDGVLSDTGLASPMNPNNNQPYGLSHVSFCFDTPVVPYFALGVEKDAAGSYDRTIEWKLEKSVDPVSHTGNAGELAGTSTWTVVATKSETLDNYMVTGEITITNPNIIDVDFTIADELSDGTPADVTCPAYTVPAKIGTTPGEVVCTYVAYPADDSATENEVVVTVTTPNIPASDPAYAPVAFTENLIGDDEGTLDDPRFAGAPWNYGPEQISATTTRTFAEEFYCSDDASLYTGGVYEYPVINTAYLNGNLDLDESATVTVTCSLPALEVEKTADGEWDRTITWDLEKSVVEEFYSGGPGDVFTPKWTVTVTKTDSGPMNYRVTGDITITNPATVAQAFTVSDVLEDGSVADVTCPGTSDNTGTVPADGSVICEYVAYTLNDNASLNTATVSALGNGDVTATDDIGWVENLTGQEVATFNDPYGSLLDIELAGSQTFVIDDQLECSADLSEYTDGFLTFEVENIAYLNGALGLEASATVTVTCSLPALEVEKTAEGSYDRTVDWDLTKSVDPDAHTGYAGEVAGSSLWTVVATKSEELGNYKVEGTITIKNPASVAQTFMVEDVLAGESVDDISTLVKCDTYSLEPGATVVCTYEAPIKGATLNTATVTADGNPPVVATASVSYDDETLKGFDEGTLDDPRFAGAPWNYGPELISATTTRTFAEDFYCSDDASLYTDGVYEYPVINTAYLNDDIDLKASASVTVTCYIEQLDVSKTVDTSYVREHLWSIDKTVATANGEMLDGYPKVWLYVDGSGDETATWTVDVTYDGYEDRDYSVAGTITIENKGFDAVIESVDDVLGGTTIDVCGGLTFPYTLHAGATLECDYYEDGEYKGDNVVTVTTERDTYSDTKPIVWGDPTTEINETITVMDDLYGADPLGTVTARNDAQFTYTKDYAWADYGADGCGSFEYVNTASIVETKQSASATLKVNVQCYLDDTAYAMGDDATCFIPTFSRWGWTNEASAPGTYTWPVYAGAADCDLDKGTYVGDVTVSINGGVNVAFHLEEGFELMEEHVYAGYTMYPQVKRGRRTVDTVAPGQYYIEDDLSGDIYVIVHAVVMYPDPNFGPMD